MHSFIVTMLLSCLTKDNELNVKQAFREFLVSLALISNLNGHKSVELSHVKCKILTYFMMSFICSLYFLSDRVSREMSMKKMITHLSGSVYIAAP